MKRTISLLAVFIIMLGMFSGNAVAAYTDVPSGTYYEEYLLTLTERGVVQPAADGKFGPNTACTRAEFVMYLWRVAGAPEDVALSTFADVPAEAEYAKAVAWAQETGVTAGKKDGTFGVSDTVTRAQMVTFMYRFAVHMGYPDTGKTADISTFADVDTLPGHSKSTMPWGVAIGMVTGTKQNTLNHGGLASRAHAIAFIGRLLDAVEQEDVGDDPEPTPGGTVTPTPEPEPEPSGGEWVPEEGELDRDF